MNKLFQIALFLLLISPFYDLRSAVPPQTPQQPRVFINNQVNSPYGDYYYNVPTSTEVRGRTIIQNYELPPQRRLEFPTQEQNRPPPTNQSFLRDRQ